LDAGANVAIETWPTDRWDELAPIRDLVYAPDDPITVVWDKVDWAYPDSRFVAVAEGKPVSHVGFYLRQGLANGRPVRISGVGGVMTHPSHQKRGFAKRLLGLAYDEAKSRAADFSLLVCEQKNVPFYQPQGWRLFSGHMIYRQAGKSLQWTLSPVMVRDEGRRAPRAGMIDLQGKPW